MLGLLLSPLMVPHVVLGIALLRFLTQIGGSSTMWGLAAAHTVVVLPYVLAPGGGRGHRIRPQPSRRPPSRSAHRAGRCSAASNCR